MWNIMRRWRILSNAQHYLLNQHRYLREIPQNRHYFNRIVFPDIFLENSRFLLSSFNRTIVRNNSTNDADSESIIESELESNERCEYGILDSDVVSTFCLKHILYINLCDQFIDKLNKSDNLDEIIETQTSSMTKEQSVQSIIVLWEYFKPFADETGAYTSDILEYNPTIRNLLDIIKNFSSQMTPDELTVCFLYLNKLGVPMHHRTMWQLLDNSMQLIQNPDIEFSLTALSRFTVTVNSSDDLYIFFVCKDTLPRILNYLKTIETSEELRLATICLSNLHQLVSRQMLFMYKEKVQELLSVKKLNKNTVRCLLKVLQFLNYPHWSQQNTHLTTNLTLLLKEHIPSFNGKELEILFKVFQSQLEPAEIVPALIARAQVLFENCPSAELLACAALYSSPDTRLDFIHKAKKMIYSNDPIDSTTIPALFKVLRLLKVSNEKICDKYWQTVITTISSNRKEQEPYILARHCLRYMNFNNNLAGTYRNVKFEKLITSHLANDLQHGISALIPSKLAKIASFIFAYGQLIDTQSAFPTEILEKIEAMQNQFTIVDCLHISRGIQIALDLRFKYFVSPKIASQLIRLENIMAACTERHLENKNLTLEQLNIILRSYNSRKSPKRSVLFNKIIEKYKDVDKYFTSRQIRDTTYNLNASTVFIPSVCEPMVNYIVDNKQYVLGDITEKLLTCIYNLGYFPENEQLFPCAEEIIHREFNYMSGLSIVQACLALSFYRAISEELINRIFNIEFIKRLEDEIKLCYSKETYPERVFNQVMQLNRAVCLDFPEARVPWFQQNYIEAQISKVPMIRNQFHLDVKEMLLSFIPDTNLLKINEITPYGYQIDFVLHLDKNHQVIQPPKTTNIFLSQMDKIAILLMKTNSFCLNEPDQLRGKEHIRNRHLELMGYKVIQIKYSEWYSMYMSIPGAKIQYLKSLLQIE